MSNQAALHRLQEERANWRRNRPYGFWAKPKLDSRGGADLQVWQCGIPGPATTPWAGGTYVLEMVFSDAYPALPPTVTFTPALFHPNIYPNGMVCLDVLTEQGWSPSYTVAHVLASVQTLLCNPNPTSPAQVDAFHLFVNDYAQYERIVRQIATRFTIDHYAVDEGNAMRDD